MPSVCGHACPSNKILPLPAADNSMLEFEVVAIVNTPTLSIIPPVNIKLPAARLPVYVDRNDATLALLKLPLTGFAAR